MIMINKVHTGNTSRHPSFGQASDLDYSDRTYAVTGLITA